MNSRTSTRIALVLYGVLLVLLVAMARFSLRLSYLIPLLLPLAIIQRNTKQFLVQWSPFYLVIVFYDALRGIADELGRRVDYTTLPAVERWFFGGTLPTVWLQACLNDLLGGWLGWAMTAFYFGHFLLPVVVCYVFWRRRRQAFRLTMTSIVLLSLMGFVTFLLYPAAPPWLASRAGVIPPVTHWITVQLTAMFAWDRLPALYLSMNPNWVAPMPSLHAGYPFALWLCVRRHAPRVAPWLFANAIIVAVTIVIFGEHYAIDVVAGWAYALLSVRLTEALLRRETMRIPDLVRRGLEDAKQGRLITAKEDYSKHVRGDG